MLRLLALIARAHAFDDTGLNAHALFGQALQADLSEHSSNQVLPPCGVDQAQRNERFIHDADGAG